MKLSPIDEDDFKPIPDWEWHMWENELEYSRSLNRQEMLTRAGLSVFAAKRISLLPNIKNIKEYRKFSLDNIMKIRGVGIKTAKEFEGFMQSAGYPLKRPDTKLQRSLLKRDAKDLSKQIMELVNNEMFLTAADLALTLCKELRKRTI